MASYHVLEHPLLGKLRGCDSDHGTTIQYRGIKFATIEGRWKDPVVLTARFSNDEQDCTKFGPECPQALEGLDFDLSLVGNVKLDTGTRSQSELECLNLVITTPAKTEVEISNMPVVVWVHGGGLSIGSNSWPQYDLSNFVSQSAKFGKLIVGVSINYRVGPFGFLASSELGSNGNFGFKDQICAFEWVKKYIAGFGGNPDKVTAMGESAGAISISTLLVVDKPLFSQTIMMSGDVTLRQPRRMPWHDRMYADNLKLLGLESLAVKNRVQALQSLTPDEMSARLPVAQHWCAAVDGKFIREDIDLGLLGDINKGQGKPDWCKGIVVGDTLHDGTILASRVLDDPKAIKRLSQALEHQKLDQEDQEELLKAYKLSKDLDVKSQRLGLLQLCSDFRFYLPVLKVMEGWSGYRRPHCHRYHVHQPNPVAGAYTGYASHAFDVTMVLQNFNSYLPKGTIKVAQRMADTLTDFICEGRWPTGNKGADVVVFGPEDECTINTITDYENLYREKRGGLMLKLGWEKCFNIAEILQAVPSDILNNSD